MAAPIVSPRAALTQGMLPGCQLVDGSLQCVPGLSADPEQQIQILRKEISLDQSLESAIGQDRGRLEQVLISGQAEVGAILRATVAGPGEGLFHWYRLAPTQQSWQLIPEAKGSTYLVSVTDVGNQVMVVSVTGSSGTTRRTSSIPIGPIKLPTP
ncbi:hypothetical protein [Synechococcus sp. Cruz CV-v-12]|uniref:hypothetical protein n=1 Tax=Synechococcus sp. Cruz CV-v-12 TaxID=2823728 RepID=UPI0020CE13D0|nr:hypothetical protein [Synechococcus sp. Cruz CV-v-12]MCP9872724.1 hypothetical protein [Synechococcus sp. Cruz CV-v-12]